MRVFITGIDGYLGWSLAQCLCARGHQVAGADVFLRRKWVEAMGSWSATPILSMPERLRAYDDRFGRDLPFWEGNLQRYDLVEEIFREFQPEAVVHFGECPSAPYSMIDRDRAAWVQVNNLTTTLNLLFAMRDVCPRAHLLKLGAVGEYGTPGLDLPEGLFELEYRDRRERARFPRQAGFWRHWPKLHGSNGVRLACELWDLRATDIMQGVVFGARIDDAEPDERLLTRLDFDPAFGAAINRFACQAVIGHPLTLYGAGSQRRGFLPLKDSVQSLALSLENPPEAGEYRVFNQVGEEYSLIDLALKVQRVAVDMGLNASIAYLANPRSELEERYHNPDRNHLMDLGRQLSHDLDPEIGRMLRDLMGYRDRVEARRDMLMPDVRWDRRRRSVQLISRVGN